MTEPVPQRIGDAERDRAAGFLQEHLAQGRLSQEEFDDRVGAALSARTAADLTPLFSDLPAPRPDGELEPTTAAWPVYTAPGTPPSPARSSAAPVPATAAATPSKPPVALTVLAAAAWPAWLLLMFATSWSYWWFVFIPIIISSVVGKLYGDQDRDRVHGRDRHRHRELGK